MPDGEMRRKAEKDFMAGCVRFWEWIPGAASCTHKKDSMQGVSPNCPEYPRLILDHDPEGENRAFLAVYEERVVLGERRN